MLVQSEAILKDPSQYWISVINVGRFFQLQRVREVDEANEYAGQVVAGLMHVGVLRRCCGSIKHTQGVVKAVLMQVIAGLMHVGDVLAMAPAALACATGTSLEAANRLAVAYIQETGKSVCPEIVAPAVECVAPVDSFLKPKHLIDKVEGPGNVDDDILVLDNNMDVGRKMKRAFCEPGNVEHCPPITLTDACVFTTGGALDISRKEDNGGDKRYTHIEELQADFKAGALHPGTHFT